MAKKILILFLVLIPSSLMLTACPQFPETPVTVPTTKASSPGAETNTINSLPKVTTGKSSSRIAFYANDNMSEAIYIMNSDGSAITRLTNSSHRPSDNPVFCSDGRKIAFQTNRDGNFEIYIMNSNGSDQRRITNNTTDDFWPTWSPDGQMLAFVATRDGNNEIYTMSADGSNQTRLTFYDPPDEMPAWSPDGKRLAYTTLFAGLWIIDADGGKPVMLTNDRVWDPAWSPDGTKLAFSASMDRESYIFIMDADGSHRVPLTIGHEPAWSPDGKQIAFAGNLDGGDNIFIIDVDGSNRKAITEGPGNSRHPSWALVLEE